MWIAENEGAKFWLNDILITCVNGLKDLLYAINTLYPQAYIQLCIIHIVRNTLRLVSRKD